MSCSNHTKEELNALYRAMPCNTSGGGNYKSPFVGDRGIFDTSCNRLMTEYEKMIESRELAIKFMEQWGRVSGRQRALLELQTEQQRAMRRRVVKRLVTKIKRDRTKFK